MPLFGQTAWLYAPSNLIGGGVDVPREGGLAMIETRRRMTRSGAIAMLAAGLLVQPVAAVHIGATADCGAAGTFTIRAQPNGAGFEAPTLGGVILFKEGGLLTPLLAYRNGAVAWSQAEVGMAANVVDEVTCTFSIASGDWEITGVLTGYGSPAG